jgi:hypothetical protein
LDALELRSAASKNRAWETLAAQKHVLARIVVRFYKVRMEWKKVYFHFKASFLPSIFASRFGASDPKRPSESSGGTRSLVSPSEKVQRHTMSIQIGIGSGKVRVTFFRLDNEPVVSMSLPMAGGSSSPVRQFVDLPQHVASFQ